MVCGAERTLAKQEDHIGDFLLLTPIINMVYGELRAICLAPNDAYQQTWWGGLFSNRHAR